MEPFQLSYKPNSDENLKYVAFLDVLGFSALVESTEKDLIEKYFRTVIVELDQVRMLLGVQKAQHFESVLISDSIVLALPFENSADNLKSLLNGISKIQRNLALEDIWLRGGVAVGHLHVEDKGGQKIVVGPGLSRAYQLESHAAWPRVILDPKIFEKLNTDRASLIKEINGNQDKGTGSNRSVIYDKDNSDTSFHNLPLFDLPFVDYLHEIVHLDGGGDSQTAETLYRFLKGRLHSSAEHYAKYRAVITYFVSMAKAKWPDAKDWEDLL